MISDETRAAVAAERAEQGLPPTVQDVDALARIAAVLRSVEQRDTKQSKRRRRAA